MFARKSLTCALLATLLPAGSALAAKDTLIYCSPASPEAFNPQLATSGPTFVATSQVMFNRLVVLRDSDKTPAPSLATDWTISPDGKTYTFTLRKGVKFNSNKFFKPTRDFNADDVVFTVMRQKDPTNPYHKVSGGSYEYFEDMGLGKLIVEVKKLDDQHVQFTLSEPNAAFLSDWAMDFASIHSAEYADAMLKKGTPENVDTWPIGTGPYALQQYKRDALVRYIANPNYWQHPVASKHLIFSITPDPQTRLAKLKTNECQIIPTPIPEQFAAIRADKQLALHDFPGLNVGYLAFNLRKKPFDDVRVRQALNYAVDKKAIVEAVFGQSGSVADSLMPPGMLGYNDALKHYDYNPQKARELLKQAGLENGFATDIWSLPVPRPYNPNSRRIAEMIQSDWAKVGVRAKIVTWEFGQYLAGMRKGEHSTALYGWISDNGDPDNFARTLLSCSKAEGGSNISGWCDKTYDKRVNDAVQTSDRDARDKLYREAQTRFVDAAPWIPLSNGKIFYATRRDLSGYRVDVNGSDFSQATMP
ncbi:ABC transporter substrate-binding protein [Pantoea sp. 1.19]|uniref:ABC transporter substrate-binding protein n=1 Tax=Pantoea sp. 1.19 TaxID=1925589 RepID=UPI0009490358|nr:ABC transporter substrate-binding protein [Pantoea sp. 1.19]